MRLARSRTWRVLDATLLMCALLWPMWLRSAPSARQTCSATAHRALAAQQQPVRVPQLPPATQTQQSKPTATPTPAVAPKQTPSQTPSPADAAIDDDEVIR